MKRIKDIPMSWWAYCNEDPSKIEGFERWLNDDSNTKYVCHHKDELEYTSAELMDMGLYYNLSPDKLLIMTTTEHRLTHNLYCKGKMFPPIATGGRKCKSDRGRKYKPVETDKRRKPLAVEIETKPNSNKFRRYDAQMIKEIAEMLDIAQRSIKKDGKYHKAKGRKYRVLKYYE